MKNKHHLLAYVLLSAGIICIGFSAIFVKLANVPGPVSAFYRMLIAGIAVIPLWIPVKNKKNSLKDLRLVAAGGLFFSLDLALWNTSLLHTSAATSTLLANNAPVWVGLASLILFREKLSGYFWLGLVIAVLGMSVLVGLNSWMTLKFNIGDMLAVGASVFYAAYLLTTQRARNSVDTVTFMVISIFTSVIVLLVICIIMGYPLTGFSSKTWMSLTALGLITHLSGWLCINYALGHLRAAPVSVSLLGQVIVTAVFSIPILGEGISVEQIAGGMLVLTGIYFANKRPGS